jgi:glycosyltransferase involved in cell wall biosynthesis
MIKVKMVPHVDDMKTGESGIHSVIRSWWKHLPKYGIDLVDKNVDSFDILAVHAGMGGRYPPGVPVVAHCHGLYWSGDYPALSWEWVANESVITSLRRADAITVPSNWVNESIQRDMRINASVVPHGIDWNEWQHEYSYDNYILAYAKNRVMDVCNPAFITELAKRFPDKLFICTFAPKEAPGNVRVMGLIPHDKMKQVIQRAAVTISPVRETFGIMTLESLAAGTPVLGYNYGGNKDLIKHGVSGYLAQPGNIDDLADGLNYCLQYRDTLGKNANELAKSYTWDKACQILSEVYKSVMVEPNKHVSIVIPAYNYSDKISGAINSAMSQTVLPLEIIVVDDGSTDDTERVVNDLAKESHLVPITYHKQNNAGVAVARNVGISMAKGEYIVCLDADDKIDTEFIRACVESMNADPMLGIAYTGLLTVEPDGKQSVSEWPPEYNFDNMVYSGGINQIPTCCMFRKSMWKRLGGYRSRYSPNGAGSEDANFWLRAGLYGFGAKRVTDAPLFIYSYKSGRVSGNKNYREIDWRGLHPSTKDKLHPFACVATPMNSRPSHPVRQYDEPLISVIIPIGPGHKQHVFNALDSLESQTLRKWEAILIDDTGEEGGWEFDGVPNAIEAYPYVRIVKTDGKRGAGFARNRGVEIARAPLLIFLDADDNLLVPEALEKMLFVWNNTGEAVYSDYVSKAYISPEEAERLKNLNKLLSYNTKDGMAMHMSHAGDYDCARAVIQPANPLYIWNLITTLIPKQWHEEIGGFDEKMPSWEDWEYWLRLARTGKCFARISEPMVVYRFYTGGRRETGIQMPGELLSYITNKLEGVKAMCKTCGGNKKIIVNVPNKNVAQTEKNLMNDGDMLLVSYENPNRGQHKVVGAATHINYGYRAGGGTEKFYVHKADIASHPSWFRIYIPPEVVVQPVITTVAAPIPVEPILVPDFIETKAASEVITVVQPVKPMDLQSIPGVTDKIAEALHKKGIKTREDVIQLGKEGLLEIEGIGEKRATSIYNRAKQP